MSSLVKRCGRKLKNSVLTNWYEHKYSFPDLLDETCYKEKAEKLQRISSGHGKKVFFIMQRSLSGMGLYTYVCVFISFIAYAVDNGMIPVVDLKNSPNIYLPENNTEGINAWELFYQQPCGYTLETIPRDAEMIYSSPVYLPDRTPFLKSMNDEREWKLYAKIYKDFIRLNDTSKQYVEKEEAELLSGRKVLGVLCRGTDYTLHHPKNHPVQPDVDTVIKKVEEVIDRYEYIYLATEEGKITERFEKAFPGKILINKRMYYDTAGLDFSKSLIGDVKFDRMDDHYYRGMEYLSSICLLSKCSGFIGGACAGTYAAVIMNDFRYEYRYVFDLGYYE